ncbi:MAG: RNA 2',3'-cyclic phosphodiesterase [Armatimonadetes bacterium]|nr:RNA 2',3'-cyclic phosphodiesterase [Armatimonadota bacterium]
MELAPALREAVALVRERMPGTGGALRWVSSENLHFTLRFLGEITPAQVDRARIATREAAGGVTPFTISLAGVGAFPDPSRPRIIWIGVREGQEPLRALADRVEERLRRHRFSKEDRPFAPHLTVARVREPWRTGDLSGIIAALGGVEVGTQPVETVVVMESRLLPGGPMYTPLETVALGEGEREGSS